MKRTLFLTTTTIALLGPLPVGGAILLGALNDFQDGTPQGWQHAVRSPVPPSNVADAGPAGAGDGALLISTTGNGGGAGSRYIAYNNSTTWTGDYLAAGVSAIRFDVTNLGSEALSLRVSLNGPGGWFSSAAPVVVGPGSGWQSGLELGIDPSLVWSGLLGSGNVNDTLAAVSEIQILSSAIFPPRGPVRPIGEELLSAAAHFDNITAVPEPGSAVLLCAALAAMAGRRSRRQEGAGYPQPSSSTTLR